MSERVLLGSRRRLGRAELRRRPEKSAWGSDLPFGDLFIGVPKVPFSPDFTPIYPPTTGGLPGGSVVTAVDSFGLVEAQPGGETRVLVGQDVHTLAVSPTGEHVAVGLMVDDMPQPGLFMVNRTSGEATAIPFTESAAQIGPAFSPQGKILAFTGWPGPLYTYHLETDGLHRLKRGSFMKPVWSRDGKIALMESEDYTTGRLRVVSHRDGKSLAHYEPRYSDRAPIPFAFAPHDDNVLLFTQVNPKGFRSLYRLDLRTGEDQAIGIDDRDVEEVIWAPEGIVFTFWEDGSLRLAMVDPHGGEPKLLLGSGGCVRRIALTDQGQLSYLKGNARAPYELFNLNLSTGQEAQVTHLRSPFLQLDELAGAESFTFVGDDGDLIQGFYHPPTTAVLGSPPPLVMLPHAGPPYQDADEFDALVQALCRSGFAVGRVNYPGSTSRGVGFEERLIGDLGGIEVRAIQAAARHLIATGRVDPARVAIMGTSYGGTIALLPPKDDPHFYAAAVSINGISDHLAQYEKGKRLRKLQSRYLGGPLPENDEDPVFRKYRRASPVYRADLLAQRPIFLIHGELDDTVPPANHDAMLAALAESGVPLVGERMLLPNVRHILDPSTLAATTVRIVAFLYDHLAPGVAYPWEGHPLFEELGFALARLAARPISLRTAAKMVVEEDRDLTG